MRFGRVAGIGSLVGGVAAALFFACGPERDIAREKMSPSATPGAVQASALENPLHAVHINRSAPVACDGCHDIGSQTFTMPSRDKCLACHPRNENAVHGKDLPCTDCHAFGAGETRAASDCIACHKDPQGDYAALTVHTRRDCMTCHQPHGEQGVIVADCLGCHEDHERRHGNAPAAERCTTCHLPHKKAVAALDQCAQCHDRKMMRRATTGGHSACTTCHKENEEVPRDCTQCHARRPGPALGAATHTEHADCKSCHSPHDPRGTARASCLRCHDDLAPKHPSDPKLGGCLGCHDIHPGVKPAATHAVARACTSCHKAPKIQARGDNAVHGKDLTCSTCHDAHDFTAPSCGSCHDQQSLQVASAPGHAQCNACHKDPHRPVAEAGRCSACHDAEYKTAPTGHRDCTSCHQPHDGKRLPRTECTSCHKDKPQQLHGQVPGSCQSCHRAHGPGGRAQPPACQSCHRQADLPGMHAVKEHDACATCHDTHRVKKLDRQSCLSCHTDMTEHEPGATTCVGCHPFGGDE